MPNDAELSEKVFYTAPWQNVFATYLSLIAYKVRSTTVYYLAHLTQQLSWMTIVPLSLEKLVADPLSICAGLLPPLAPDLAAFKEALDKLIRAHREAYENLEEKEDSFLEWLSNKLNLDTEGEEDLHGLWEKHCSPDRSTRDLLLVAAHLPHHPEFYQYLDHLIECLYIPRFQRRFCKSVLNYTTEMNLPRGVNKILFVFTSLTEEAMINFYPTTEPNLFYNTFVMTALIKLSHLGGYLAAHHIAILLEQKMYATSSTTELAFLKDFFDRLYPQWEAQYPLIARYCRFRIYTRFFLQKVNQYSLNEYITNWFGHRNSFTPEPGDPFGIISFDPITQEIQMFAHQFDEISQIIAEDFLFLCQEVLIPTDSNSSASRHSYGRYALEQYQFIASCRKNIWDFLRDCMCDFQAAAMTSFALSNFDQKEACLLGTLLKKVQGVGQENALALGERILSASKDTSFALLRFHQKEVLILRRLLKDTQGIEQESALALENKIRAISNREDGHKQLECTLTEYGLLKKILQENDHDMLSKKLVKVDDYKKLEYTPPECELLKEVLEKEGKEVLSEKLVTSPKDPQVVLKRFSVIPFLSALILQASPEKFFATNAPPLYAYSRP